MLGSPKTDNHVPRRLGLGRQHALQGDEAAGLALRRHAQPDGGPLAGEDQARRDAAHAVPPLSTTSSRPSTRSSASPRRAWSTASRRTRSTASASPTPSTTRRRRAGCSPSTSRSWAAARSTTTAGWPPPSARGSRGSRGCRPASASGRPTRTSGSSTTSTRTGPRPTTSPPKMPEKLAQMKEMFLIEAARNKALPDRRRAVGSRAAPRAAHLHRPTREWTFTGDITRMPEFCAPALGNRPNVVTIDADIPANANGVLYALGGARRRPHLLRRRRHPLLRVQPLHHSAHEDPRRREAAGRAR